MKRFFFTTIAALFACSICNAQAQEVANESEQSVFLSFFDQAQNPIYKKEKFGKITLASGGLLKLTPETITSLRTGECAAYITLTTYENGIYYSSAIELDEVPSCIEMLEYAIENEIKITPSHYVEISTTTRDGAQVGVRYDPEKSRWQLEIIHTKFTPTPSSFFGKAEIQELRDALKKHQAFLEEKLR